MGYKIVKNKYLSDNVMAGQGVIPGIDRHISGFLF